MKNKRPVTPLLLLLFVLPFALVGCNSSSSSSSQVETPSSLSNQLSNLRNLDITGSGPLSIVNADGISSKTTADSSAAKNIVQLTDNGELQVISFENQDGVQVEYSETLSPKHIDRNGGFLLINFSNNNNEPSLRNLVFVRVSDGAAYHIDDGRRVRLVYDGNYSYRQFYDTDNGVYIRLTNEDYESGFYKLSFSQDTATATRFGPTLSGCGSDFLTDQFGNLTHTDCGSWKVVTSSGTMSPVKPDTFNWRSFVGASGHIYKEGSRLSASGMESESYTTTQNPINGNVGIQVTQTDIVDIHGEITYIINSDGVVEYDSANPNSAGNVNYYYPSQDWNHSSSGDFRDFVATDELFFIGTAQGLATIDRNSNAIDNVLTELVDVKSLVLGNDKITITGKNASFESIIGKYDTVSGVWEVIENLGSTQDAFQLIRIN